MSSPSSEILTPGSKILIDARAAELKERLLKGRNRKGSRDTSLTPTLERMQSSAAADKNPHPGSIPRSSTSSPFVPHPMPMQPPETSVPADANDIAALIASISSASRPEADDKARLSRPASAGSASALQSQGSRHVARTTADVPAAENSSRPPSRGFKPTQPASAPEEGHITNGPATQGRDPGIPQQPNKHQNYSLPKADTAANNLSTAASAPTTKNPEDARPVEMQKRPSISSSAPQVEEAGLKSKIDHHPEPRQLVPSNIYYSTSAASISRNMDTERVTKPLDPRQGEDRSGNDARMNPPALDPSQRLAALFELDSDLRDWLTLTQYFDVETRARKLTRYRKLAEMDAEQKRMQAEQQRLDAEREKLLAEEESERGMVWRTSTATPLPPPTPMPPTLLPPNQNNSNNNAAASSKADNTPATPVAMADAEISAEPQPAVSAKREANDEASPRFAKVPRLEGHDSGTKNGDSMQSEGSNGFRRDGRPSSSYGPESRYRESRPAPFGRDPSPRRRLSRNSPTGSYGGGEYSEKGPFYARGRAPLSPGYPPRGASYVKHGNHRGDGGRPTHQRSPSPMGWRDDYKPYRLPKPISLGKKGGQYCATPV